MEGARRREGIMRLVMMGGASLTSRQRRICQRSRSRKGGPRRLPVQKGAREDETTEAQRITRGCKGSIKGREGPLRLRPDLHLGHLLELRLPLCLLELVRGLVYHGDVLGVDALDDPEGREACPAADVHDLCA